MRRSGFRAVVGGVGRRRVHGLRSQRADTDLAAEERQFAVGRAMTSAPKPQAWGEPQELADAMAEAGIRRDHPGASDREVFLRRVARTLDRATMVRCCGWDPEGGAAP